MIILHNGWELQSWEMRDSPKPFEIYYCSSQDSSQDSIQDSSQDSSQGLDQKNANKYGELPLPNVFNS